MHKSADTIGTMFFKSYWSSDFQNILEIGSFDVNGSLRVHKPQGSRWIGVDLEMGPGVDIVISSSSELPFQNGEFDVVLASSVFEHDPAFWLTFGEADC
jgi:predicted SAM-dependent methyltransferase